jgi:autochaperone domain-containing protein
VSTAFGIQGQTFNGFSPLQIENSGDFIVLSTGSTAFGIQGQTFNGNSPLDIMNSGSFEVTALNDAFGIQAQTSDGNAPIDIVNSGALTVTSTGPFSDAFGIDTNALAGNSPIDIVNSGDLTSIGVERAFGLRAYTGGAGGTTSPVDIENIGNIAATGGTQAFGIVAVTSGAGSPVAIMNSGDIVVSGTGITGDGFGIYAYTEDLNSPINIVNSGDITAFGAGDAARGISARANQTGSPISIVNSGAVTASGLNDFGIFAQGSSNNPTTITNSGAISAASFFAIEVLGGPAMIFNTGAITGFVDLTANADSFRNQQGGTFATRLTSNFGTGDDLFNNQGTVHAVAVGASQPAFVNLERFENSGLIPMVDGDVGDVFTISNTVGGTDLDFVAGSGALAVDAFLGPPGSTADNFIIDGDVFGKTQVLLNNTRPGGGAFNPVGIPVVFVPNGQVQSNAFFMPQPFDSGLFDWDVYFVPTGGGSGFFELKSFPGGGAHVLPQLLTAAQDVFHTTNETWFDRTADLRVLLNGGGAYGAGGGKLDGAQGNLTPGVWLKGSGTWLDQEDSAKTTAYGQTYKYNLNRDLDTWNLEGGFDFGKRGMWAEGDALLFGILGGAILGSLDYDQLVRKFDIEGGEVGGYVTYLNGGLFVDTLAKVDFVEFDSNGAPGLPSSLDATTWGVRTDAGYRFGQFRRGPFVEPLATIAVAWSDIDDFTFAGNSVKFNDEADVRGRLGLRVGTSREVWTGIVAEPFVIGSVWGHLSGENKATVTLLGTKFGPFTDEPDDVWGVVSTGVNFFSPGTQSSLFAKLDVTFGDEVEGISAKGGMRYNW